MKYYVFIVTFMYFNVFFSRRSFEDIDGTLKTDNSRNGVHRFKTKVIMLKKKKVQNT